MSSLSCLLSKSLQAGLWASQGGADNFEGTDAHSLPLLRFQTHGVRYVAGMSFGEALKLSASTTLEGALDWFLALTPSSARLKEADTFFHTEVQAGEALYIPQAYFFVEQAVSDCGGIFWRPVQSNRERTKDFRQILDVTEGTLVMRAMALILPKDDDDDDAGYSPPHLPDITTLAEPDNVIQASCTTP